MIRYPKPPPIKAFNLVDSLKVPLAFESRGLDFKTIFHGCEILGRNTQFLEVVEAEPILKNTVQPIQYTGTRCFLGVKKGFIGKFVQTLAIRDMQQTKYPIPITESLAASNEISLK